MAIRDEATRRKIEAEFERGLSPRRVGMEWKDFGDFHYQVEGIGASKIPTARISWNSAMETIAEIRGTLRRDGVTLDPWEPPAHTE